MPPARLTKAHKFFQDSKGKLPLPVQHLPYTTGCLSPVDRLPRPPNAVVPTYNPDDPFAQIERATNKIEKLVTKYENDSEDSHLKMLAELDSSFQINALEPDEILDQSKRVVDNLISQNKELKDTQSSMLGSVQTWLQREEQVLRDQDDDMKIIAKEVFSLPQNSDEMMEVLNSSTGSNQERIARAMSLHTDIIAKSNLLVQGLQKKMLEQMRLIKELEEKLAAAEPKMGRRSKRDNIGKVDYQKQLEQAMTRIGQQEDTIKKLNEKIEQLIGQSVLTSRDAGDESLMEDNLQKSHDLMAMECKIGNLENLLNTASDSIFKMKHDIQGLEADKAYLLTQVQGLKELVEVERCKREAQTREFLNKLADEDDGSGKNTRAIEDMKKIVALEKEITRLKNQIEDEKKKANEENQKHLDQLKKEFDLRQLEMKKRQTAAAMSGGNHSAVLEAMQKQHDEETEYLKKSYLEQIAKLKKMHQEELKKQSDEKDKIITDLQLLNHKILSEKGGVDLGNHIEMLTKQFEDKEIELKQQLHDKLENARNDFQKHQAKLMEEIRKKEEEIANMTIAINELTKKPPKIPKPETPPPPTPVEEEKPKEEEDKSEKLEIDADLPDDAKSAMIDYQMKLEKLYTKKLHQQTEDIEKRWRQQLEEQTETLQAEINAIQKEYAYTIEALNEKISKLEAEKSPIDTNDDGEIEELRAKIKELEKEIQVKEGEKLKYQIENELLQKAATAGNDDFALIELTQAFAEQTQELNSLKQKYDDVKDQLLLYKDKTEKAEKKLMKSSRISSREYEFIFNDILWLAPPDPMPENVEPIIEKAPHIFKKYFEVTSDISPQIQELLARTRGTTPASVHVDLDFSGTNSLEVPDIDENSENPIPEVRTIIQTIETPRPMVRLLTEISHQFWVDFVLPEYVEPLPYLPPNPILPKTFHNQLLKGEFVEIAPIIKRLSFKKPALQFFTDEKLPLNRSHFAPVAFSVEPKIEIKVDEAKLEGGFVSVRQMIISKAIPMNFFEEKTDIGCQIDRIEIKTPHLRSQPPIEVITIEQGICRPPDAVILDPSPIVAPLPPKPDAPPRPNQIITAAGELINIPPVNSVTAETDKEAVDTIKKMALQETRDLSKQLELVISEMQTIDQEQDPVKKLQLQETLGISLDVEKDSLISEMKERITELEQLIANSSEQPEENIIVEKANYVNTETDAVEEESVQAMEIGTQTMYSARPSSAHLSSYHSIIDIKDEAIIQRPKSATMKLESQEIYKKSQAQLTTQRQPSIANIKKVNDTDVCSSSTQVTVETYPFDCYF